MRPLLLAALVALAPAIAVAQPAPPPGKEQKKNANPCRDEVNAALSKLRRSSWFRMETNMITENGPTSMQIDYVLPDKMHQKVSTTLTGKKSEIILVGKQAWSRNDNGPWAALPYEVIQQLQSQIQDQVLAEQTDIGEYSCKGRTTFEGKDVLSYKLEDETGADANGARNQAFRMFYVDSMTGLPVSNALIAPGREDKPVFKAVYSFPIDLKIEPPKDAPAAPPTASHVPQNNDK